MERRKVMFLVLSVCLSKGKELGAHVTTTHNATGHLL